MKKLFTLSILFLAFNSYAQIGVKAGLTYNADQGLIKTAQASYQQKGEGSIGYHVGLFKTFYFTGLYVKPELLYVSYKNEYKLPTDQSFNITHSRIDVPVSVGTTMMKVLRLQAGPVFSYYLKENVGLDKISDLKQDDFSLGLQLGAGVEFQKLTVDLRYDFPLGKRETNFVQDKQYSFQTENTPKLLHLSVGYNF